jgi:methyl-accepting chemotaxis protein
MTTSPATLAPVPSRLIRHAPFAGWALAALGAALAWPGGLLGLLGAALVLAGTALALRTAPPPESRETSAAGDAEATTSGQNQNRPASSTPGDSARAAIAQAAGRVGAEVMVSTVVPVWSRQMEVTRDAAAEGLSGILDQFSQMSATLNTLVSDIQGYAVTAEPGAVDQSVRRESPALEALLAPSRRAFAQRDTAVAELSRCAEALSELQQLAKQTREIGRHTRLVAFNASIEAHRGKTGQGSPGAESGSQAVAVELRTVATRMAEAGERVDQVVTQLLNGIRKLSRESAIGDTSEEELRLELDLQARQALAALLGGLGSALQGSGSVQDASRALQDQLEAIFVHFQFGDRISQMLSIVANDMTQFAAWVAANPRATYSDASAWLTALEASYTMDEQRSSHHGNVHVEQSAGVEFF